LKSSGATALNENGKSELPEKIMKRQYQGEAL
jgi:hypothetical protein